MKRFIQLLLIALLCVSCDPVHYISFRNATAKEAVVTIKLKPDADKDIYRSLQDTHPIEGDSIVVHIPAKESESLFFGIGNWGDAGVTDLAGTMKSLEIETTEIRTVYKSKAAIETLLKNNVKGIVFKSEIAIAIE